jgi:hypothetical protein
MSMKPLHHARVLGHEIVEPDEVAEQRALAPEVRVAAVVVVDGRFSQAGTFTFASAGGTNGVYA